MKFATYKINERVTYGSVIEIENGIGFTDIGAIHGNNLRKWIELDALDRLKEIAKELPVVKPSNGDHHDGHNGVAVGVVTVLMLTGMIVRTETTIWRRAQADQARLYKGRSVDHPTTTNIDGGSGGGSGDGGVDDHDADEINA